MPLSSGQNTKTRVSSMWNFSYYSESTESRCTTVTLYARSKHVIACVLNSRTYSALVLQMLPNFMLPGTRFGRLKYLLLSFDGKVNVCMMGLLRWRGDCLAAVWRHLLLACTLTAICCLPACLPACLHVAPSTRGGVFPTEKGNFAYF